MNNIFKASYFGHSQLVSLLILIFCLCPTSVKADGQNSVSRGEFLHWIMIANDIEVKLGEASNPFADVPRDHEYYEFIHTARGLIVDGYGGSNNFGPDDPVIHQDASKMLLNGFGIDYLPSCSSRPYPDVSTNYWACPYIQKLKEIKALSGLFSQNDDILFYPDNELNKATAAKMVAVLWAYKKGITSPFGYFYDVAEKQELGDYTGHRSIGTLYEQPVSGNPSAINYVVSGGTKVSTQSVTNFKVNDTCNNCTYYWEASAGTLSKVTDDFSEISLIAPSNVDTIYLYSFVSNGLGSVGIKRKTLAVVDAYDDTANSTLSVAFDRGDQEFVLSYQVGNSVDYMRIEYSFDANAWQTAFEKNISAIRSGNQSEAINHYENFNRIYFRLVTRSDGQPVVTGAVRQLDYNPQQSSQTEPPDAPDLFDLGGTTTKPEVEIRFRKVLDSNRRHNATHYELMYADNYLFNNATVVTIADTTTGDNLYETLSYTVTNLSDNTRYYFRVRAVNALGHSRWSVPVRTRIELEDFPVFNTSFQQPANNATAVSKLPELCWEASDEEGDDLEYALRWGTSPSELNFSVSFNQGQECYDFAAFEESPLAPGTTYFWKVLVREDGHYKEYYGGEYISSPIWSFTTVNDGHDLAITNVVAAPDSQLIPYSEYFIDVTLQNLGSEPAPIKRLQPYYVKPGSDTEFRCCDELMTDALAPGATTTIRMRLRFEDDVVTAPSGKVYDNILVSGNSQIRVEIQHPSDQDTNNANNSYGFNISYSDAGAPEITASTFNLLGDVNDGGLFVRQGNRRRIVADAKDDLLLTSLGVYYQENPSAQWHEIYIENNDDESHGFGWDWDVPQLNLTLEARLKIVATDGSGNKAEAISEPFRVVSNRLTGSLQNLPSQLNVGDDVNLISDISNDYPLHYYWVNLYAGQKIKLVDTTWEKLPENLSLVIPNNNRLAASQAWFEVVVYDVWGNRLELQSNRFELIADTQSDGPVKEISQLHQGSTPPSNASYWTDNALPRFHQVDSQGGKHLIFSRKNSYWVTDNNGSTKDHYFEPENAYYYQFIDKNGVAQPEKELPPGYQYLEFLLDDQDIGYLLLKRGQQLGILRIENGVFSSVQKEFNRHHFEIESNKFYDSNTKSSDLLNHGYLHKGYWYDLNSIRRNVKRRPFDAGNLGAEQTLSFSNSLSKGYEPERDLRAVHRDNTIYFVDENDSTLVWFDVASLTAGSAELPVNWDRDFEGGNGQKLALFVENGQLYLVMRGVLFNFDNGSFSKIADLHLVYANERSSIGPVEDSDANWEKLVDRFDVVVTSQGTYATVYFGNRYGAISAYNINYPQFEEIDIFQLDSANGDLTNINVENQYQFNSNTHFIPFDERILQIDYQGTSNGDSELYVSLIDPTRGEAIKSLFPIRALKFDRDHSLSTRDYRLLKDEVGGKYYAVAAGAIYRVETKDESDPITYYNDETLYKHKGQVYVSYRYGGGAFDGTFAYMEGDNYRSRNRLPENLYYRNRNLSKDGATQIFSQEYFPVSTRFGRTVNTDNYLLEDSDLYALNSDNFLVEGTAICNIGRYYDFVGISSHSKFEFITYSQATNEQADQLNLVKNDCGVYRSVPIELNTGIRDFLYSGANSTYLIAAFENGERHVELIRYHIANQTLETFPLPTVTGREWWTFKANSNFEFGLFWHSGDNMFYGYGDIIGDLTPPPLTLSLSASTVTPGETITVTWNTTEGASTLASAELDVIVDGTRTTLNTSSSVFTGNLNYTVPDDTTATKVNFELRISDTNGNVGFTSTVLNVTQPIVISEFSANKYLATDDDLVELRWLIKGMSQGEIPSLTLVNQHTGEETALNNDSQDLFELSTIGLNGEYQVRLAVRGETALLPDILKVQGDSLGYQTGAFSPGQASYLAGGTGTILFAWDYDVSGIQNALSRVYMQASGSTEFREIGFSYDQQFRYEAEELIGTVNWYVETVWNGLTYRSDTRSLEIRNLGNVASVTVAIIERNGARPKLSVSWPEVEGAEEYGIYIRRFDGAIRQVRQTAGSETGIETIDYFAQDEIGIAAIAGESQSEITFSEPTQIEPRVPTSIRFVNVASKADQAQNKIDVVTEPTDAYTVVQFQISDLTRQTDPEIFATTQDNTAELPELTPGNTYEIVAQPLYPDGTLIPGVEVTMLITEPFNYQAITGKPTLTIVASTPASHSLSWAGVDFAETYRVVRESASGNIDVVQENALTSFIDTDVQQNDSYRYYVIARNPISEQTSNITGWLNDQPPVLQLPGNKSFTTSDINGLAKNSVEFSAYLALAVAVDAIDGVLTVDNNAPDLMATGQHVINFVTIDSGGNRVEGSSTITVEYEAPNAAPTAISDSVQTSEDVAFTFELQASDGEGDALTYALVTLPTSAEVELNAANVTYTPAPNFNGSDRLTFKVSDGVQESNTATVDILVLPVNDAPQISGIPPSSALIGQQYTFNPDTVDVDGDELEFSVNNLPDWLQFSSTSGSLTGTPFEAHVGLYESVSISVTDGGQTVSLTPFNITVSRSNNAPVIQDETVSTNEDTPVAVTLSGNDVDNDTLIYGILEQASSGVASIDGNKLTYTPEENFNGTDSVIVSVSDGIDTAQAFVSVTIIAVNDAPFISGTPAGSVLPNELYEFTPTVSDVENDTLVFSTEGLPGWALFDTRTGKLTGTPEESDIGTYSDIIVTVSDGDKSSSLAPFNIEVVTSNSAPTIQDESVSTNEDTPITVVLSASDADNHTLTFNVVSQGSIGIASTEGGQMTYTPNENVSGSDSVIVAVSDGITTAQATISIVINPVNDAPVIGGTPSTEALTGKEYVFTPTASDVDNDTLTFSIAKQPGWTVFDANSGALTGTPDDTNVGTYTDIVISVSDGDATTSLVPFSIFVTGSNNAPELQNGSTSTNEDTQVVMVLTGNDIDNDPLTYAVVSQGTLGTAIVDGDQLTYTPDENVNGADTFTVSVSDGRASAHATISVVINAVNDPPVINGSPATLALTKQEYQFTPTASDVENDALTFSIVNQPGWTDFDVTTGALTGTPLESDVGQTEGIVISVTDGLITTALESFSLLVKSSNTAPTAEDITLYTREERSFLNSLSGDDIDGDPLTYAIITHGELGVASVSDGLLSYRPNPDVYGTDTLLLTVSDGIAEPVEFTVTIIILPENDPPVISGTPVTTIEVGETYSFTPAVFDVDGDELEFRIANHPDWMSIDSATGKVTGTPEKEDVGVSADIVVSVSDGQVRVSLDAFDLTVQPDSGSVEKSVAVIIAAGRNDSKALGAITQHSNMAFDALTKQGFSEQQIYVLSPDVEARGFDAVNTDTAISDVWSYFENETITDLTIFVAGEGNVNQFEMTDSAISQSEWASLIDEADAAISGNLTVIMDIPGAAAWIANLAKQDIDREEHTFSSESRVVIAAASVGESVRWLRGGGSAFSWYFWAEIARGKSVNEAFNVAANAVSSAFQQAQLDDTGDGISNSMQEGLVASLVFIGRANKPEDKVPVLGEVAHQMITDTLVEISALGVVADTDSLTMKATVIHPFVNGNAAETAEVLLTETGEGRWSGNFELPRKGGLYRVILDAIDDAGNIAAPKAISIINENYEDVFELDDEVALSTLIRSNDEGQYHTLTGGDQDWYRFYVQNSGEQRIVINRVSDDLHPRITVYSGDNKELYRLTDSQTIDLDAGEHFIQVAHDQPVTGNNHGYQLAIENVQMQEMATLSGVLLDSDSTPVNNATITSSSGAQTRTDSHGAFNLQLTQGNTTLDVSTGSIDQQFEVTVPKTGIVSLVLTLEYSVTPSDEGTSKTYRFVHHDYDCDGRADIGVRRPSNSHWYLLNSNGKDLLTDHDDGISRFRFGLQVGDIPVSGDFDGDCISDIAFRRPSNQFWYVKLSSNGEILRLRFGAQESDIPVPADYDGDGKTDIAVRRPSNSMWYILNSSGVDRLTGYSDGISRKRFGRQAEDIPVPADFDGDGKADIAVRRPTNSYWYILNSGGRDLLTDQEDGISRVKFGLQESDIPVVADYDGDGRDDIAVRRPSNQYWYIRNSSNGEVQRINFGKQSEDIPIPADYDGDGIDDIAVRRPSNQTFYIKSSATGDIYRERFGSQRDDIPVAAPLWLKFKIVHLNQ